MNWLLLPLLLACGKSTTGSSAEPTAASAAPAEEAELDFTATLTIDAEPGGKRFQGVWLREENGKSWLVAYRKREPWTWFEGQQVEVSGRPYSPDPRAQQILADHIHVVSLRLTEQAIEAGADPIGLGPSTEMTGTFTQHTGKAGSKIEGQTWTTFEVEGQGMPYQVRNADGREGEQTIRARVVSRSPYVARMGGDEIWVE